MLGWSRLQAKFLNAGDLTGCNGTKQEKTEVSVVSVNSC